MKIGIMTWYKYHNYGSVLQATALYNAVANLGYEPIMINYKPKGDIKTAKTLFSIAKKTKEITFNYLKGNTFYDRYGQLFDEFINNNLRETSLCDSYVELKELNKDISGFVCGSDQIWSPLTFDAKYFLNFAPENKILAYAPSIGSNEIGNQELKNKMKQLISRFDYLSVREKQGQKIIKEITNKDALVALDPTLLLDYDLWSNYENKKITKKLNKKYILCYFLGESNNYIKQIEKFAKENDLLIYNIPYYKKKKINEYNIDLSVGPSEFITLVKNAECVFTDSFHGTIFSINFNKKFYTYRRFKNNDYKNQNSRVENILELFDLTNRLIDRNTKIDNSDIDYKIVNKKLKQKRKESVEFLKESLTSITNDDKELKVKEHITKYCCGCGSCAAVCPTDAIKIVNDNEGFQHYKIDKSKCIDCGMCRRVCPMLHLDTLNMHNSKKLYSFKNPSVLDKSSSGGFSHSLSELLSKDYYVCGVWYDNKNDIAKHIIIKPNNIDELSKIQGSKYIQSNSANIFKELIEIGKKNKVVFFGTPCQVAGLDKLLKIKKIRENFVLVDTICHGVPTKYLWDKYLNELFKKNKKLLNSHDVYFRDKKYTWRNRKITIKNLKCRYTESENKSDFYNFFKRGDCDMQSCYECPYRQNSSADIRMGDYWGSRFIKDKTGVSMIISNTDKGEKIIQKMIKSNNYEIKEFSLEDYWTVQFPYNQSTPVFREKLISELKDKNTNIHSLRKKYHRYDDIIDKIIKIVNKIRVK